MTADEIRIASLNEALASSREIVQTLTDELEGRATNAASLAQVHVDEALQEHLRKDEFLAMLGHELRNPLAALSHGLALLDKVTGDPGRSAELRSMMVRQTKRMSDMLDQLLDIGRVVSGKVQIEKLAIDLAGPVRAAAETVMLRLAPERLTFTLALPVENIHVRGDSLRLAQVIVNLLTNAVSYTDVGGHITLTLDAEGENARITVRDDGAGMAAELVPHVFDVFTQEPRELDRERGGLGLGLPLVRRLVELHGGKATASSGGLGKGSEFVITLPRLREPPPTQAPDEVRASKEVVFRPRRILIVEDESLMADALAELLALDGHQTRAVYDGLAALEAATMFHPEIVLLDLGLPGVDGYEVARRLRTALGRKVYIIAVTGYAKDAARLADAGFDEHLIKPPDLDKLAALIAAWVGPTAHTAPI